MIFNFLFTLNIRCSKKEVYIFIFNLLFVDIVAVSETDGEEDEHLNDNHEFVETFTSKPETLHDSSFTSSAFKNISTFISSHIGSNSSSSSNKSKRQVFFIIYDIK